MECLRLANGTEMVIRPMRSEDGDRLQAGYERLSPETKYKRFLAPKPHLSSSDVRYLVGVDGAHHFALVATPVSDPERIVAVGRFVRIEELPQTAEVAIVVGDEFQGEGLGSALLERLANAALERGIRRLQATVLADNLPAHRLVRHLPLQHMRERHVEAIDEIEVELAA
jgi:RimJ/RimL family protein N-acetyltransferase